MPLLDNDKEKIPDMKENEIPEWVAIGGIILLFIWIITFMLLKMAGIIPAYVMRLCIYPVIAILFIAYVIVKNKNSKI